MTDKKTAPPIATPTPPAKAPVVKAPKTGGSYRVSCSCPTPLQFNPLTVEAESAEDAFEQFKQQNGIQGTDHEVEITAVE